MIDAIVAFSGTVLYVLAVYVRGRAAVADPGLRWWYLASVPLACLLAFNQFMGFFGWYMTSREQAAIRVLVVPIVWIGPAAVGRARLGRR